MILFSLSVRDSPDSDEWAEVLTARPYHEVFNYLERRGVCLSTRLLALRQASDLALASPVCSALVTNVRSGARTYRVLAVYVNDRVSPVQNFYDGYPDWVYTFENTIAKFQEGDVVEVLPGNGIWDGEVGRVVHDTATINGLYKVVFGDGARHNFAHDELKLSQERLPLDV